MPLISKLLLDVGREFLWSPLTVKKLCDHRLHHRDRFNECLTCKRQTSTKFYSNDSAASCQQQCFEFCSEFADHQQQDCRNDLSIYKDEANDHLSPQLHFLTTCVLNDSNYNYDYNLNNPLPCDIQFQLLDRRLVRSFSAPILSAGDKMSLQIINVDIDIDDHSTHVTRDHESDPNHHKVLLRIDSETAACLNRESVGEESSTFHCENSLKSINKRTNESQLFFDGDSSKDIRRYKCKNFSCESLLSTINCNESYFHQKVNSRQETFNQPDDSCQCSYPRRNKCQSYQEMDPKTLLLTPRRSNRSACQRSGRLISDKRLRYAIFDKLRRLRRSQSHGRSENKNSSQHLGLRSFVLRTKGLYKDVKRRFSASHLTDEEMKSTGGGEDGLRLVTSLTSDNINERVNEAIETVLLRHCSSLESFQSSQSSRDSGCGSSIKTNSLYTNSNRSSLSNADDVNGMNFLFRGQFISYARAINDYIPCPYDRDALAFKRGDIISIIEKNVNGTWIGMANGKIGHFKFVMVEEMKNMGKFMNNKITLKVNPFMSTTSESEIEEQEKREAEASSIYDKLESRLNESEGTMTLEEVLSIIGLGDCGYFNLFALNGLQDLDSFREVGHTDTLEALGISNRTDQQVLLNAAQIIRENLNRSATTSDTSSRRQQNCFWDCNSQSAPVTPAVDSQLNLDEIVAKFNDTLVSSRQSYDEIQTVAKITKHLREKNSQRTSARRVNVLCKNDDNDDDDYGNNPVEEDHESVCGFTILKTNQTSDDCDDYEQNLAQLSSVEISQLNDFDKQNQESGLIIPAKNKSVVRKLLKKLDIKPIYNAEKNKFKQITGSCSVLDLSDNAYKNVKTSENYNFNNKNALKSLVECARKSCSTANTSPASTNSTNNNINVICQPLLEALSRKLQSEEINLAEEPYSDSTGFCGIPPGLVHRYADEFQKDICQIAETLEHLRLRKLTLLGRRGILNNYLVDSSIGFSVDFANYESLYNWLVSLGLPMYYERFKKAEINDLFTVLHLNKVDLIEKCNIKEQNHLRILTNAIGALHLKQLDVADV